MPKLGFKNIIIIFSVVFLIVAFVLSKGQAKDTGGLLKTINVGECGGSTNCRDNLFSNSTIDWEKDKALLEGLSTSNPEECNQIFNILWANSKKENLEARRALLLYMIQFNGPYMYLPTFSYDNLSRYRHVTILAIHSIDADLNNEALKFLRETYLLFSSRTKAGGRFDSCVMATRSQDCVKSEVQDNVFPSFDAFSKEIDLFIGAGKKAICAVRP